MVMSFAKTNVLSSDKPKITGANRRVIDGPQTAEPMIAMLARNREPRLWFARRPSHDIPWRDSPGSRSARLNK